MKKCSLLFLFLICSITVFGYTVVLNNGKQVRGKLMSEDQNLIVLQDSTGIKLIFQKSTVNLEKTQSINANESQPVNEAASSSDAKTVTNETGKKSLAEIAKENRNKPHKNVRVLSQDDVASLPELTRIGSETEIQSPAAGTQPPKSAAAKTPEDESAKRSALLDRLEQEQNRLSEEEQQCRDQGNQDQPGLTLHTKKGNPCPPGLITQFPCHATPSNTPGACAQAEATQRNIDSIQQQLDQMAANPQ